MAPALAITLAAVVVVLAASAARLDARSAGALPAWAEDRAVATVVGRVAGDPHPVRSRVPDGGRWAVRVHPTEVSARGHVQRDVHGPLLVLGDAAWSSVVAGSQVRLTGRLLPPRPGDPTIAAVVTQTDPVTVDRGAWPWRVAERLRTGLRAACAGLPRDAAGLLPALVVGDTSALSVRLRADLQAAGLTHLTAVSGANCAIVAATVGGSLALAGIGRRGRVAGTLLAIAGFVVLARPEPSVLRAAVMGGVALVGILLARRGVAVAALCTATVALLAVDPWLSRSFGFALSVLATGALILLVPAWVERWPLPRLPATALAVPLAAQAVTAPVVVLLQPSVSLVGIPANVLAAPAVAPATIGGVLAAALSLLWPAGAHGTAVVAGLPTSWIALVAHVGARVPGGSLPWLPGRLGALLLAVMVAGALVASVRPRGLGRGSGPEPGADSQLPAARDDGSYARASDAYARADADANSDAYARDADANPRANPRTDADPDAHADTDTDADARADARADTDVYAYAGGLSRIPRIGFAALRRVRGRRRTGGLPASLRARRDGGRISPPWQALRRAALDDAPHRWAPRSRERPRLPLTWAVGLLVLAVLLGWVLGPRILGGGRGAAAAWIVVQCDVGQGDAMLLRTGERRAMLVDAGPDPDAADSCLRQWGVDALDLVVVTHFHADHVGGLAGALRGRGRPPVITSPCRRPDDGYRTMLDAVRAAGSDVTVGRDGVAGRVGDSRWPIQWRLLWPPADAAGCVATGPGDEGDAANDSSVVLAAEVQGIQVLALGDLETDAQRSLVAAVRGAKPVDVVKVAHHGSAKQEPDLYEAVRPRVALIGVGPGNDYGQPTSFTVQMLDRLGARVLRTDEQGDIAVVGPASRLAALTARRRRTTARASQRAPPHGCGRCRRLVGGCPRGSVRRFARWA